MLNFVTLPTRSTLTTRPSAGETITRGSDGISRFGFRKKNATKPASSITKKAARYSPSTNARAADTKRGIRKRNASFTIMNAIKQGLYQRIFADYPDFIGVIPDNPRRCRFSKYVDDSTRSETWRSWRSSDPSNGASFFSVEFLQCDRAPSCDGDCATLRDALHTAYVPRPDGETLDSRKSSVP